MQRLDISCVKVISYMMRKLVSLHKLGTLHAFHHRHDTEGTTGVFLYGMATGGIVTEESWRNLME